MTVQRRLDSTKWDHERLERRVKGLKNLRKLKIVIKRVQETETVFAQIALFSEKETNLKQKCAL